METLRERNGKEREGMWCGLSINHLVQIEKRADGGIMQANGKKEKKRGQIIKAIENGRPIFYARGKEERE